MLLILGTSQTTHWPVLSYAESAVVLGKLACLSNPHSIPLLHGCSYLTTGLLR